MKKIKNNLSLVICILFCFNSLLAQEYVGPSKSNITQVYNLHNDEIHPSIQTAKTATGSLQIPFFDDFSYAATNIRPSFLLWQDSNVYVNTTYPIAPPSIGVATFDGLNKRGYPYAPNLTNTNIAFPADMLTSKPINLKIVTATSQTLQPSDSTALIFYYQARGRGENPEVSDSLVVDFFKPNQNKWQTVWFSRGNTNPNTNDTVFKRAFVWINDTSFLQDNFKFRIKNYANTSGNFDHWHVDYVYLDKNRKQIADTTFNDISLGFVPSSLIKDYYSMPWNHYLAGNMGTNQNVWIRNNSNGNINMSYASEFRNNTNSIVHTYNGGTNGSLGRFKYTGWSNFQAHSNPSFNYTFSPFSDSADFTIKHYIGTTAFSNDFSKTNDTVIQIQKFRNYFAYDDGSSEGGYYVQAIGGKIAQKIVTTITDTLRAVRIYFDPIGNIANTSAYTFSIIIWDNANGVPSNIIYRNSADSVKYVNAPFKPFFEYVLDSKQILTAGVYYIGFQQNIASGIPVGFDKNTNSSSKLYYDSGNGWTPSGIYGSVMMNPVFGKKIVVVGNKENQNEITNLLLYPNPSNEQFSIYLESGNTEAAFQNATIKVTSSLGQVLMQNELVNGSCTVNTSQLSDGIYFVSVYSKNQHLLSTKKIIVHH